MSSLKNKNILLCVTGSIAAYKACELLRTLRKEGANIQVMMSYSAEKFIGKATFSALSNNKVLTNLFSEESSQSIEHVDLSFKLDLVVVAPATANIICKAAQGVADEIVSTTLSICDVPILFAPAMNFRMWENKATIDAIKKIKKRGNIIVQPEEGYLASLHKGKGRLADVNIIFNQIKKVFHYNLILENQNILITAGPTIESIDSIRYISNHSSGKQGYEIAKQLSLMGAKIFLITGPTNIPIPTNIKTIKVKTAKEMNKAVQNNLPADIAIFAAAVSDIRPKYFKDFKLKKEKLNKITLIKNNDIIKNICLNTKKRPKLVIGFTVETNNLITKALKKIKIKGCDWLIANELNKKNQVFGSDYNKITIIQKNKISQLKKMTKIDVAKNIVNQIIKNFEYKKLKEV